MAREKIFTNTSSVQALVEADIKKAFKVLCVKNGTTPSEYIRKLIEQKVKDNSL